MELYSHAIAALGGYAALMFVLTALSAMGRVDDLRCDCGQVKRDYANAVYRKGRAHANAVESAGPFIAALVAAILIGVAPFWVNLFASVFLTARVVMAFVHIGTTNQPLRSLFWSISMLCVLALAVMAIWGAL
ncbi:MULTISPECIES: MAPEG family protein [Roseobacteraceae]|uniref:MAPEG family protein n=1 Tax=Pseudosulfitobacter pseudonitzschiae TaxID=1402135 RepID=A0A221K119_9RHOB|nr:MULTISPECIES: MAPEG family protein [Roseobacteraceae]ASM72669.1 MAPEG family protein [Pseudosulfitobacter pseudonitzschiae]